MIQMNKNNNIGRNFPKKKKIIIEYQKKDWKIFSPSADTIVNRNISILSNLMVLEKMERQIYQTGKQNLFYCK